MNDATAFLLAAFVYLKLPDDIEAFVLLQALVFKVDPDKLLEGYRTVYAIGYAEGCSAYKAGSDSNLNHPPKV